jgi:hypothetical protein
VLFRSQLHHVADQKEVFDICAAWIGFDTVDRVETVDL